MSHSVASRYEPVVHVQTLRACACGAPHPLATGHPADACPACGKPAARPGPAQTVGVALPGLAGLVSRGCLRVGAALSTLARKVDR